MAAAKTKLDNMERLFAALADKTRLRLLNLMREDEVCVCFFTEVLNESQPKISRHLAYLRKAGLVKARREGKWMLYRILEPKDAVAASLLRNTLTLLKEQSGMKSEYEELAAVCCSPDVPVTIAKAPKPEALLEQAESPQPTSGGEIETYLL